MRMDWLLEQLMKIARFYMNEAVSAAKARSLAALNVAGPLPATAVEVDGSDTLSAALSAVETAEALNSAEQRLVMGKGRSVESAEAELSAAFDALKVEISTRSAKVAGCLTALAFVKAATVAVQTMESATPTQQFRMGEGAAAFGGGMRRQRMKSFMDKMSSKRRPAEDGGSPSPPLSPRGGSATAVGAGAAAGARGDGGASGAASSGATAGARGGAGASAAAGAAGVAAGMHSSFVPSGIVRKKTQLQMSCKELLENSESFERPAPGAARGA